MREAMQRKPGRKGERFLTERASREVLANRWKCCTASGTCLQRKGWRMMNE